MECARFTFTATAGLLSEVRLCGVAVVLRGLPYTNVYSRRRGQTKRFLCRCGFRSGRSRVDIKTYLYKLAEQGWSCTVCKACTEDGDFARECILQAVLGGAIEAGMQASDDFSSSVIDLCAVIAALYACSKRPILNNYFTVQNNWSVNLVQNVSELLHRT